MFVRVRIRTIFRFLLFFAATKIIANYNEREWGWLNKQGQDKEVDHYNEIRVYSVYMKNEGEISESVVGFVSFEDFGIGAHNEMYHTQNLRNLIKMIGEKYKKIVVNPIGSKISKSQTTLSSLFMRTLAYENHIRSFEGLPKIEVYFYDFSKNQI